MSATSRAKPISWVAMQHRHALGLELADGLEHLADELGVERAGHLVEQHRPRAARRRPARSRPAAAGRPRAGRGGRRSRPVEPEAREQLARRPPPPRSRATPWARTMPRTTFSSTSGGGRGCRPGRRGRAGGAPRPASTEGSVITSPSRKTSPSSMSSSRSMQRSSVDLPEPEAPISATASCSPTVEVDAAQHLVARRTTWSRRGPRGPARSSVRPRLRRGPSGRGAAPAGP